MTATVVLAAPEDLPAIAAIYNEAIADRNATADLEPKSAEDLRHWYDAHPPGAAPVYVCRQDGEVVGWCSVSAYRAGRPAVGDVGEVSYYVAASHRGQGIGSALLRHALADCARIGKRVVFAIVIEGNEASLRLLRAHGFAQWGFLPGVVSIDGARKGHVYLGREV